MSPPPPETFHALPDSVWPPVGIAAPMSAQFDPLGHRPGGGNSPAVTATLFNVTAEPVP
jgi:hypothetical protein